MQSDPKKILKSIFNLNSDQEFNAKALEIFRYQSKNCIPYKQYLQHLDIDPTSICNVDNIPFLPITLFKSNTILTGDKKFEKTFKSSGTTTSTRSSHFVKDLKVYEQSFTKSFEYFYGKPEAYCFLALLPNYLEQGDSSLVYMLNSFINQSSDHRSGFYKTTTGLPEILNQLQKEKKPTVLFGVTYALLDLIELRRFNFPQLIVMETGGMKGRRKEITKEALHDILTNAFCVDKIHSEYGMTELLSQAYSEGDGLFSCPPWMQIKIRPLDDPFGPFETEKTGGIEIIDLANLYSCSFIATQDLGKKTIDGNFKIMGRFDFADVRGCNLLADN